MTLVVFLQEDEDVLSVYRNLKIFCETAPWMEARRLIITWVSSMWVTVSGWLNG